MRESDGERDHSDERLARPSAQSSTTNDDDDDSMGNDEGMGHDEGDVSMRGDEGMEPGIDEAEPTTPGGPREAARSEAARGEAARAASSEAATPEPATEAATPEPESTAATPASSNAGSSSDARARRQYGERGEVRPSQQARRAAKRTRQHEAPGS